MFEKSRVRRVRRRGSRGQIKCECGAVVSCGKRGASSHHGVSLTRKMKEGEKEQEEDLVLVEVVEHSWEVELVLVLVLVEVVEHSWEVELEED